MKRNNTRTMNGSPVATASTPTVDATASTPTVDTPTHNQEPTGTVAHDGTPAVRDTPATMGLVAAMNTKVIDGIPYDGTIHHTGAAYPFKGNRALIYGLLKDGMGVAEFCRAARVAARGGVEDVRIYLRKGLVVVRDAKGVQVQPPVTPAPTV